uniref:SH3 and multiple ankyrin repeat domains 3 n=1 Tax=Equus asinus TaxID=9793 RepID=A0A9L0JH00_EQUAS
MWLLCLAARWSRAPAVLFSSLGELSSISAQRSPGGPGGGASYPVRPGGRYPVARRAPSPVKPASLERVEGLGAGAGGAGRPFGLTPPTILKSSSLSIPHEPKEVRFVVRSVSARSRSPSPSPLPSPAPGPGPGPGGSPARAGPSSKSRCSSGASSTWATGWRASTWASTATASRTTRSRARTCLRSPRTTSWSWASRAWATA